jgi:hypothetical protein
MDVLSRLGDPAQVTTEPHRDLFVRRDLLEIHRIYQAASNHFTINAPARHIDILLIQQYQL